MPLPFGLVDGDKVAILALTNARTSVAAGELLGDGIVVAVGVPDDTIDDISVRDKSVSTH